MFTDDGCNSNSSEHEEQEQSTEHEIRLTELKLNDPVHKVDLSWYFQTQVSDEIISLVYCNKIDFVEMQNNNIATNFISVKNLSAIDSKIYEY